MVELQLFDSERDTEIRCEHKLRFTAFIKVEVLILD